MVMFVKLFSIVIMAFGLVFMATPNVLRGWGNFWKKGKRMYAGGVMSLLFAILFLRAASVCRVTWFINLVGIIALIKGIALFALGPKKFIPIIDFWTKKSGKFMRFFAIFVLAFGLLILYSA